MSRSAHVGHVHATRTRHPFFGALPRSPFLFSALLCLVSSLLNVLSKVRARLEEHKKPKETKTKKTIKE